MFYTSCVSREVQCSGERRGTLDFWKMREEEWGR
jgi:hypothetical protein